MSNAQAKHYTIHHSCALHTSIVRPKQFLLVARNRNTQRWGPKFYWCFCFLGVKNINWRRDLKHLFIRPLLMCLNSKNWRKSFSKIWYLVICINFSDTFQIRWQVLNFKNFRGLPHANICIWIVLIEDDVIIRRSIIVTWEDGTVQIFENNPNE